MDGKTIHNPSAIPVWVAIGGTAHKLEGGKTTVIP